VRIIIKCPESDSPLRGRIHLRGLSLRPTSNLLQSGGGPYILNNDPLVESPTMMLALADSTVSDGFGIVHAMVDGL